MIELDRHQVTRLLERAATGDDDAADELFRTLYGELRRLADLVVGDRGGRHRFQPTSILNDAYLRIAGKQERAYNDRKHFLAVAARAMRHVIADRARSRDAKKRGGGWDRVTLDAVIDSAHEVELDLVALDDALERLGHLDERQARVVEMRFFAGLQEVEIAEVLGVSDRTVRNDWRCARLWLERELRLADDPTPEPEP